MDLCNMILVKRYSQIDYFTRQLAISILFSFTLALYIFRKNIQPFNPICLVYFVFTFMLCIIVLNEVLQSNWFQKKISPSQKAVLITGCDRGFGYGFAKTLSDAGFQVFAGCLYPFHSDIVKLNLHPRIHCLKMDVTKHGEIQLALDYVEKHLQNNELWAVINNAGISKGSDIETTSIEKIQEVLDVNLMGTVRVTKTFLPLLQKSKGRVINIASAAGRLLLPGFLPYSVSKNAVIAFSDGLRMEMRKYDVHVISIEPWIYRTKLSDMSGISREIEKEWQSKKSEGSAQDVKHLKKAAMDLFSWGASSNLEEVYNVVIEATTLKYPLYRYSPGKWYLNAVICLLYFVPQPVTDFIMCNLIFKR